MNKTPIVWHKKHFDPLAAERISRILNCNLVVAQLLCIRGIDSPESAYAFLNPSFQNLTDPFLLKDMKKAVSRIADAINNKEKILIFGDYDADGVTATALLILFLDHAGIEASWHVPHRTKEGYSLKEPHIEMAVDQNIDLIITVDCGSDSHEAVLAAAREDIDVIITDHHEIRGTLPPAHSIINPKRTDCSAGLDYLAGVGVAFYLIIALRNHLRHLGFWEDIEEPNLRQYCDLVSIGTLADMVPLVGENRILSSAGIQVMQRYLRPGLKALTEISGISAPFINSDDISYRLAPRLNAAGRLSHARICVSLLICHEEASARQTAAVLDQLNRKRQLTEIDMIKEIETRFLQDPSILNRPALVLWHKDWNPGVLGIAASQIVKKYLKPAALISTSQHPGVGSCRSLQSIDIHQILTACSSQLDRFGGHMLAAGFSIRHENLDDFKKAFENAVESARESELSRAEIDIDGYLEIDGITIDLMNQIDLLRPFGTDNPEPVFACEDIKVLSNSIIGTRHRKMVLEKKGPQPDVRIEALWFNIDPNEPCPGYFNKIAYKLKMNTFRKHPVPQIIIEHATFLS